MSGVYINVEKIKEIMDAKIRPRIEYIIMRNQILNTCADRGKDID